MDNQTGGKRVKRSVILGVTLLITIVGSWWAVSWPLSGSLSAISVQEGEVAPQDILAPYAVSYISEVLTEEQREEAARAVPDSYTQPDPEIAREQMKLLRSALDYIENVRADVFSSQEQKIVDLAALESMRLSPEVSEAILNLSDARWQAIRQESIIVLEQVMRNTIREYELDRVRQSVPSLVSLSIPEEEVVIVSEIVAAFVAPNSYYSEEQTEQARLESRSNVTPVTRSIAAGETIIRRGEIIQAEDIEALKQVGLLTSYNNWEIQSGVIAIVFLAVIFMLLFFRAYPDSIQQTKQAVLLAVLFLVFLGLKRRFVTGHIVLPYLYPFAAYPLIVSALIDRRTAIFTAFPLAILMTYGSANALDLTLYYTLGGIMGLLILRKPQRISAYLRVAAITAVSGAAVISAYRILNPSTDSTGLLTLIGASVFQGIASAGITLLLEYILAPLLDLTTTLQLLELERPDHPLLAKFLQEAPGTYQHTLQVANLVEQAAEKINANSLLARVGALYHDVGKLEDPQFYIENQLPGQLNTHDDMEPETSAQKVIQHVLDGVKLAEQYNLPKRISDFMLEHHGTLITAYQYNQALNNVDGDESQLDPSHFRYPGPRPQSAETALLMLADGCEAYARAKRPESEEELRALIKEMVEKRIEAHQLDEAPLTLKEIDTVIDSFTATLKGTYHSRVDYPQVKKKPGTSAGMDVDTAPIAGEASQLDANL
jgi:putative nucleotidyltransferase with HDIG domain